MQSDGVSMTDRLARLKKAERDLAACLDQLDALDLAVIASHVDLGHAQLMREIAREMGGRDDVRRPGAFLPLR
jgi:hypothetical protein